jgi:aspartate racemase
MKTLGLVGGTSWVSSLDYYRLLNERLNRRLGGDSFARCILYSFNFGDIKKLTDGQDWPRLLVLVTEVCRNLSSSGAEAIVLCANTMHLLAEDLQRAIDIPIIHIAEATALAVKQQGLSRVALLGTRFTMEMGFFHARLARHGIETVVPGAVDRGWVHHTIFEELGNGILQDATKRRYLDIMQELKQAGAQGIILGCTEIPLLIKPSDSELPLFNTLELHVDAAVEFAA